MEASYEEPLLVFQHQTQNRTPKEKTERKRESQLYKLNTLKCTKLLGFYHGSFKINTDQRIQFG